MAPLDLVATPRICGQIILQLHCNFITGLDNCKLISSNVQASAEDEVTSNENSKSGAVSISGALGPSAAYLNGQYFPEPSTERVGRVVYCKRGDPSMCIEHRAGLWQLKPTLHKGTDQLIAAVKGGCALDGCASRKWKLTADSQTQNYQANLSAKCEFSFRLGVLAGYVGTMNELLRTDPLSYEILYGTEGSRKDELADLERACTDAYARMEQFPLDALAGMKMTPISNVSSE